jgi:hypothetical protein
LKGPHGFRKEKGGARALSEMRHKWSLWEPFINPIMVQDDTNNIFKKRKRKKKTSEIE